MLCYQLLRAARGCSVLLSIAPSSIESAMFPRGILQTRVRFGSGRRRHWRGGWLQPTDGPMNQRPLRQKDRAVSGCDESMLLRYPGIAAEDWKNGAPTTPTLFERSRIRFIEERGRGHTEAPVCVAEHRMSGSVVNHHGGQRITGGKQPTPRRVQAPSLSSEICRFPVAQSLIARESSAPGNPNTGKSVRTVLIALVLRAWRRT